MSIISKLAIAAGLATALSTAAFAQADLSGKVIGFSQIGSESGWRAAETSVTRSEAEARGVDLKFADAQQKQENQIKAIRGFIAQGVDAILVAPVVATGWDDVLTEAKEAEIPVVLLDRGVDAPEDLYLTSIASDQVLEGRVAGEWLVNEVGGEPCNVVELQGTVGSSPAINRKQGFEEGIANASNITITQSQTGEFTSAKGKEVMEAFLKSSNNGADICAVYAHNDDMAVGAIQAIKDAGLKPGTDILVVSIDAVPDIFSAIAAGEANATVELTPNMAGPAFDALDAYLKDGKAPNNTVARTWVALALYAPEKALQIPEQETGSAAATWRAYARGEALVRLGRVGEARAELAKLAGGTNPVQQIAQGVLAGRIAMAEGDYKAAAAVYEAAARIQHKELLGWDPPSWWFPIDRAAAAAQLAGGNPRKAEALARASLASWKHDPLALWVLGKSQEAQGKAAGAQALDEAARLWKGDIARLTPALI